MFQRFFSENEESNPEPDDYAPNPSRWSNCNHKIKDISYLWKRKHSDICLKWCEYLKRDKFGQHDESDESDVQVIESLIESRQKKQVKLPNFKERSLIKKN